mmetsp:Transcript_38619/g.111027  ORF Transcript_38619/g.111027 Transcript_38619/m.111027 type:complete len:294 (+) Transcript_38619:50-931(+)
MSATALDHFNRFQERHSREAQFSEDIRHVIHGGGGGSASSARGDGVGTSSGRQRGMRARSPGLAAGATLALTSGPGPDVHTMAQRNKEHARGSGCPFDDHTAFSRIEAGVDRSQPPTLSQHKEAYEVAWNIGRRNRDVQRKVGHAAPWDAPETSVPTSTYVDAISSGQAAVPLAPAATRRRGYPPTISDGSADPMMSYIGAKSEAVQHKLRMVQSSENIISGGYLEGESRTAVPVGRSAHRPPQPERLLPQALMKAQMDSSGRPSQDRVAFLNAQVISEACRDRNSNSLLHFG